MFELRPGYLDGATRQAAGWMDAEKGRLKLRVQRLQGKHWPEPGTPEVRHQHTGRNRDPESSHVLGGLCGQSSQGRYSTN